MSAMEHLLGEPPAAEPGIVAVGPNFGHMLALFALAAVLVTGGQFLTLFGAQQLHLAGHRTITEYANLYRTDPRFLVPSEGLGYALVALLAAPVFRAWWRLPFARGLHWGGAAALRYAGRLALLGLLCGFGIGALGSLLPMPKDPPIMADMMRSPAGAWIMLVFGCTGAPLFEEMCFRGFLLPAFLNFFRWLSLEGRLTPGAVAWLGVPVSALLTSLPFALLHGAQVSHAWAPVLLIGLVSLVLCVVRLRLDSLASSTVVHAAYNFTLFAGILLQTGGFRHLERLSGH